MPKMINVDEDPTWKLYHRGVVSIAVFNAFMCAVACYFTRITGTTGVLFWGGLWLVLLVVVTVPLRWVFHLNVECYRIVCSRCVYCGYKLGRTDGCCTECGHQNQPATEE